ncbi:hypothetical protein B0H14DRAFT_2635656 [Mycena olivaceomarginata]|nr:hypothetical protein B0H14DRAFT_2635656 [Mycena olivaceomarginata]
MYDYKSGCSCLPSRVLKSCRVSVASAKKTRCLGMPLRFSDKEVNLLRDDALPRPPERRCQSIALRTYARTAPDPSPAQNSADSADSLAAPGMPSDASPYVAEYHPSPNKQKARAQGPRSGSNSGGTGHTTCFPSSCLCSCASGMKRSRCAPPTSLRCRRRDHVPVKPAPWTSQYLAVDIGVLEFVRRLFVNLPPNNTAFCNTLEGFLASRGYKLTTKDTLRVRFANALEWYTTLRTMVGNEIDKLLNATRQILRGDEISDPPATPAHSSRCPIRARCFPSRGATFPPSVSPQRRFPAPAPRAGPGPGHAHRAHVSEETDSEDEGAGERPIPSPTPPPRTRPSDYLISRCPACFGGLEHDALPTSGHRDRPRPPSYASPTRFVSEATAQKMDEHVETVRPPNLPKRSNHGGEEEADGYEGEMQAADEKREAASTQFFDDTGLMAIYVAHDRVLWLVNMRTPGEKQYYASRPARNAFPAPAPQHPRGGALRYSMSATSFLRQVWVFWAGTSTASSSRCLSSTPSCTAGRASLYIIHSSVVVLVSRTERDASAFGIPSASLFLICEVAGYHNRLHTIDSQIEHADKASLGRLGSWLGKRREAERDLAECRIEEDVLREEWKKQVAAQTKPAQSTAVKDTRKAPRSKKSILARKRVNALFQSMTVLRDALGDPDLTAHVLLDYYAARMNAKVMKDRLRQRLREHKFELDLIERSFRCSRSENQKNDHAGAAIKRREPTISNTVKEYNKLCADHRVADPEQEGPRRRGGTESHSCQRYFPVGRRRRDLARHGPRRGHSACSMARRRQSAGWNPRDAAEGPLPNEEAPRLKRENADTCRLVRHGVGGGIGDDEDCSRFVSQCAPAQCSISYKLRRKELLGTISGVTASYGNGQDSDEEGNSDDDEGRAQTTRRRRGGTSCCMTTVQQMKVDNGGEAIKAGPRMVLTDFFQRAAAVAGACAARVRGLLAKRKRDMANIDETRYSDPDFGDVNWELDQTFGEVSEWLESYLDKHEEAKEGDGEVPAGIRASAEADSDGVVIVFNIGFSLTICTQALQYLILCATDLAKKWEPPDSPDRRPENQPHQLSLALSSCFSTTISPTRLGAGWGGMQIIQRDDLRSQIKIDSGWKPENWKDGGERVDETGSWGET